MNIKISEIKETIIFIDFILVYKCEKKSFPFISSPFKIFIQSPQLGFMVNIRFDNWRACVFVCVVLCVYNKICIWQLATCYMFDLYFEYLILLLYVMFYFYGVDNKQKVECVIIFKTLANFGASNFQHYLEVFPLFST
jgi:hypothetical protein